MRETLTRTDAEDMVEQMAYYLFPPLCNSLAQ